MQEDSEKAEIKKERNRYIKWLKVASWNYKVKITIKNKQKDPY